VDGTEVVGEKKPTWALLQCTCLLLSPKRTSRKSLSFYFLYPPLKKTPVFIIQMADYSSVAIWLVGVWRFVGAIAMTSKTSAGVYEIVGKGAAGGPDEILGY